MLERNKTMEGHKIGACGMLGQTTFENEKSARRKEEFSVKDVRLGPFPVKRREWLGWLSFEMVGEYLPFGIIWSITTIRE